MAKYEKGAGFHKDNFLSGLAKQVRSIEMSGGGSRKYGPTHVTTREWIAIKWLMIGWVILYYLLLSNTTIFNSRNSKDLEYVSNVKIVYWIEI